ncbi:type II toxin-antitoxin system death-on-curing family toxin [candidate division KSB1 bacterium]
MARVKHTVSNLALEAKLDLDEALVLLWDEGIDQVESPTDTIPKKKVNLARRALGIATKKDFTSPEYWQKIFQTDTNGLREILTSLNIVMRPSVRRMPKGSIAKLKAESRRRGNIADVSEKEVTPDAVQIPKPLKWEIIGHQRELRMLKLEEVSAIHNALVVDFQEADDPISPAGIKSEDLLASALYRPSTSLENEIKYPTTEMAGAALMHSIVLNHPFHNGNKRTALVSLLVFLDENGLLLTCKENDLFRLVIKVAQHRLVGETNVSDLADREALEIARWINSNSRLVERGDRRVQWRKLKKILIDYNCYFSIATGVGNRINISRNVPEKGLFGRKKTRTLRTQVFYSTNGREADKNTLGKIRHDLHLDNLNGIDARAFYGPQAHTPDHFITLYRKTLRRLSKL